MPDFTFQPQRTFEGYSFKHLAANATTVVKTGSGVVSAVLLNTIGGSSNTLTLYDGLSASGTVIAIIGTTVAAARFPIGVLFVTGLTVVIATGTAADVTIVYL